MAVDVESKLMADEHRFHKALREGHISTVKRMILNKRVAIQCKDLANGWTSLFYAIRYGLNDLVRFLLDQGHETFGYSLDNEQQTALMIAVAYDNPAAFSLYMSRYPDTINLKNKLGETAVILAAKKGHDDYIERLLDNGAEVNAVDLDGCSALHYAAAYGFYDTIQLLVERGCRYATHNKKGWTALDYSYSTAVAVHLQDCARIAHEGRKLMQKRMTKRNRRHLIEE